jgi:hypothetical protein
MTEALADMAPAETSRAAPRQAAAAARNAEFAMISLLEPTGRKCIKCNIHGGGAGWKPEKAGIPPVNVVSEGRPGG